MQNFAKNSLWTRAMAAQAAGTDDTLTGTAISVAAARDITFVFAFGTITATAVTTCKLQGCTASDGTGATDLLGTGVSVAADDDDQIAVIELTAPIKYAYVRPAIVRATANVVVDGVISIQTKHANAPPTQGATVVDVETHANPAAGTA